MVSCTSFEVYLDHNLLYQGDAEGLKPNMTLDISAEGVLAFVGLQCFDVDSDGESLSGSVGRGRMRLGPPLLTFRAYGR